MKHRFHLLSGTSAFLAAFLFIASLSTASATLPGPMSASFAKGAKFTVAGYDANRPALSGFPVLVRIAENSPVGFSYDDLQSKATGDDIAFVNMLGNGLPFEIDTWDTSGTSLVWVRLPSMQNGTEFVMCWGSDTSGKTVCSESPFSGYVGVWHMSEASGPVADSSGNGFAATPSGTAAATACIAVPGPVGNGRQCSTALGAANLSYLSIPSYDNSKQVGNTFAVSGWFNIGSGQSGNDNDARLFSRKENYQNTHGWEVLWKTGKEIRVRGAASGDNIKVTGVDYAGKGWKHIFVVYDGKNSVFYENGAQKGSKTNGTAATENGRPLAIGGYANDNGSQLLGSVDECRLLDAVPSADWVAAEYDSMNDAAFLTAGEAETYSGVLPPSVSIVISAPQYTNAAFTVSVGTVGTGAMSADVSVRFAATDDFASPLWTTNYTVTGADAQVFSRVGLSTGTTYYVQAEIENDQNESNTSPLVSFTTLAPGAPAGTATFLERGFSTLTATATATDFGVGAEGATLRLEASTDGFATVVAGAEAAAVLDAAASLSLFGLAPDTTYALRVRIRNDWGLDTFVALSDTATRAVPFATTGIGWTFSQDGSTLDISFGVSGIYDGATGTATLTYAGASQGAKPVSEAGTLTWPAIPAADGAATATVVLSASLGGQTYSQTFSATIAPGSQAVSVSSLAEHATVPTAIRLHAGDVAVLPELGGPQSYLVPNTRFLALDGTTVTALEPGIAAVQLRENGATVATMCVFVLPDPIPGGDVFIAKFDNGASNWGNANWNDSSKWEKLGSATNDTWPQRAGDIAFIPLCANTSAEITLATDLTLGALYAGSSGDLASTLKLVYSGDGNLRLAFDRRDGQPAVFQINANTTTDNGNKFRMLTTLTNVRLAWLVDSFLDLGWDGQGDGKNRARLERQNASRLYGFEIPEGVTLVFRNVDTQGVNYANGRLQPGPLVGGGTFWNRSQSTLLWSNSEDFAEFTGLLRDSGGYGCASTDRCGASFLRSASATNVTAETIGWAPANNYVPVDGWKYGVGEFEFGVNHETGASAVHPGTNWFPRSFTLHGGMTRVNCEQKAWRLEMEPEVEDRKRTDILTIACGLNTFWGTGRNPGKANGCTPINVFEADALVHQNKAALVLKDDSLRSNPETVTNEMTILHGWRAFAVGDTTVDPRTSAAHAVVPWIACPLDTYLYKQLAFAAFDAEDRLVRPVITSITSTDGGASASGQNASLYDRQITFLSDNSYLALFLQNKNKEKKLGEDKTLTITSGGLVMNDPDTAIGTEDGGSANGSLTLGDANHPAYVWAQSTDPAKPNAIWSPVTAPGGFVSAYTGNLVLGGDQTGIGDELVVNAGTLALGSAASSCALAKDLPIRVYANATLSLPNATSTAGQEIRFDGAAGWFGKVSIPAGVEASCRKVYVRDYPESPEWESLPRGTYGASGTGAEFIRDDLFAGAGTLLVKTDDKRLPTLVILK